MQNLITAFFSSDGYLLRNEKAITLREYFDLGKENESGTLIYLTDIFSTNKEGDESFYIGDCTQYHEPSENDGGFGWDYDHPRFNKIVSQVYLPNRQSSPRF